MTAHAAAGAIDVVAELTATRIQIPGYPQVRFSGKGRVSDLSYLRR